MDGLAPPLRCLSEIKMAMLNGSSLREALRSYLQMTEDEFSSCVHRWLLLVEAQQDTKALKLKLQSPYRRSLLETFEHGLSGEPILERLNELESEVHRACFDELERHLQKLPLLTMIPLLLCQFPAFLMLLLGPLLHEFMQGLSG